MAVFSAIGAAASPLEVHRQWVRDNGVDPRPSPPPLDATVFIGSTPRQDFSADVRRDLVYNSKPLIAAPEPVSAIHTPAYTHASYQMAAVPGLRLRAELGPMIWVHADRGAPGDVGILLDTWA